MDERDLLNRRLVRERSARKEAEKLLEEKSRELFFVNQQLEQVALFAELSPHPVLRFDRAGKLVLANPASKTFFGAQAIIGASIESIVPAIDTPYLQEVIDDDQLFQIGLKINEFYFQFVIKGLSQYGYANFYGTDITQLEEAKREVQNAHSQLLQAQKLESLGQLAAGIAHEINTPIQYIGDNTRFLEVAFKKLDDVLDKSKQLVDEFKEGRALDSLLDEVEKTIQETRMDYMREEIPFAIEESLGGVNQVASIVHAMKQFSHPGKKNKALCDINQIIENTINVARNEWKYVAEIETDFDENLPQIPCLQSELNQVFLNIIVNAAHAINDVEKSSITELGKISISTSHVGEVVEIRISDTGTGIPEEIRNRVFDPFFTTKEVGKGTGQGLAIAYNVIFDKHDGTIELESEIGQGSTFIIRLPVEPVLEEAIHEEAVV